MYALNEHVFAYSRHTHALEGTIYPLTVTCGAEHTDFAGTVAECLKAFEHRLSVMQGEHRRRQRQRTVRDHLHFLPLAVFVRGDEHVIGDILTEFKVVEISLADP